MATATYVFEVDWGNDGSFTGGDVITSDVLGTGIVSIDRGSDASGDPLGDVLSAAAQFGVTNNDNTYHPENSGGSLYGNLVPGRDTRIRTTSPSATNLFRGYLTDFDVRPNPDERLVDFSALGGLHWLANQNIVTGIEHGITTGEAVDAVLDAAGWAAGRRAIDTGGSALAVWWASGNALDALRDILLAEGPGARLFENGDGDIVFHDRHRRLTQTTSTTSQATFRDTGTDPLFGIPHEYRGGWDRIINDVALTVQQYVKQPLQTVWTYPGGTISLNASQSRVFRFDLDVSAEGLVAPVEDIDFTVVTGSIASATLDKTSGARVKITLTAGVSATVVTGLQVRGQPWAEGDSFEVTDSDATSQTAYGVQTLRTTLPWIDENTARDLASAIVSDYKDPRPIVDIRVSNATSTRLTQVLTREVNDRITVIDTDSGMNKQFHIERISHEISQAGLVHVATMTAIAVGTPLVAAGEVFILDDATQGKLGTGKLGY